jgi:hypothetical protein
MAGTAGIFTGTGWSFLHLFLSVETGHSGYSGRYRNGIDNHGMNTIVSKAVTNLMT